VGGVVDGVGEDDGVAEPCDGEDCDGEDFPNVSWGGAIARRAAAPAEPIAQVDQLQAGSARSSAAAS